MTACSRIEDDVQNVPEAMVEIFAMYSIRTFCLPLSHYGGEWNTLLAFEDIVWEQSMQFGDGK